MKVRITHLKAPWPEGARVGDVVEVGAAIPGWARGKCVPLDESEVSPPEPAVLVNEAVAAALASAGAEYAKELDVVVKHHEVAVSALKQDMAEAQAERDAARAEADDLKARLAAAEKALAEAQAPKADVKAKSK